MPQSKRTTLTLSFLWLFIFTHSLYTSSAEAIDADSIQMVYVQDTLCAYVQEIWQPGYVSKSGHFVSHVEKLEKIQNRKMTRRNKARLDSLSATLRDCDALSTSDSGPKERPLGTLASTIEFKSIWGILVNVSLQLHRYVVPSLLSGAFHEVRQDYWEHIHIHGWSLERAAQRFAFGEIKDYYGIRMRVQPIYGCGPGRSLSRCLRGHDHNFHYCHVFTQRVTGEWTCWEHTFR